MIKSIPLNLPKDLKGYFSKNSAIWKTLFIKKYYRRVPTMAQWVKTAAAPVAAEAQVPSSKDPALPQLQHRSHPWLGFNPRPRNVHMPWVWPFKKKKIHTKPICKLELSWNKCCFISVKRINVSECAFNTFGSQST